jgi:hypothetical protein
MIDKFAKRKWWLKKKEPIGHKRTKQRGKLKQLTSYDDKFLKDGCFKDGVENIYNIHM